MANPTTIPKQLYVTVQYRGDTNNDDGLLGFASPYTKDAPFQKRKASQDSWAYGSGVTVNIADDDSITVEGKGRRGGYANGEEWDTAMLFIANCYPRILDNSPVEGFQIAKSVRRYGWGGSGNVKWRITDPRGFDLEISSENFASVLACTTMVNGVIQGKCTWGRMGKDNILLPESSEPFLEAQKLTAKVNANLGIKDIQTGDIVELLNKHHDNQYEYMGSFKIYTIDPVQSDSRYRWDYSHHTIAAKGKDRYIFRDLEDNTFVAVSTPKIGAIVTKSAAPLDKAATAKNITETCRGRISSIYEPVVLVSAVKVDVSSMKFDFVPSAVKFDGKFPVEDVNSYYQEMVDKNLVYDDGKTAWIAHQDRNYNHGTSGINSYLLQVDRDKLLQGTITKVGTSSTQGYHWNRYDRFEQNKMAADPAMTFSNLRLTVGADQYIVQRLY
ncbi:MAG TPA: hypothetical protein VFM18_18130 [Methanosarcina sp.]|nr:hypothetical protein [Methanosarcina sp.]